MSSLSVYGITTEWSSEIRRSRNDCRIFSFVNRGLTSAIADGILILIFHNGSGDYCR